MMREFPYLLQIWLLPHIRPFCSSHPFSYLTDERSLIERLIPAFRLPERNFSEWRHFLEELTPTQFLWAARWNPGGPMIMGCPEIIGIPLLSHLGSTLVFPNRAIRQLGASFAPDRFLRVREFRRLWETRITQELYFPEHPTDEERAFSATSAYVAQFYSSDSIPVRRTQTVPIPRTPLAVTLEAKCFAQVAMRAELQSIREERDGLRGELMDARSEVANYRELQRELAQTRGKAANLDREIAS
ncbi:hypothetical protein CRG98_018769 [Punica granatum]|uniref:Uncharacterized protein n=1 Tax=Punica granatum TaxID=22663 RepID=A0A2I0JWZ6_PUNGR|nr:hypothetical protein CRG98_018769 [Punica granatum]